MSKRIFKAIGLRAQKAFRKSAKRMAIDLSRLPKERRQEILRKYLQNKSPSRRAALKITLEKAIKEKH